MLFFDEFLLYLVGIFIRYFLWSAEVSSVAIPSIARISDGSTSRDQISGRMLCIFPIFLQTIPMGIVTTILVLISNANIFWPRIGIGPFITNFPQYKSLGKRHMLSRNLCFHLCLFRHYMLLKSQCRWIYHFTGYSIIYQLYWIEAIQFPPSNSQETKILIAVLVDISNGFYQHTSDLLLVIIYDHHKFSNKLISLILQVLSQSIITQLNLLLEDKNKWFIQSSELYLRFISVTWSMSIRFLVRILISTHNLILLSVTLRQLLQCSLDSQSNKTNSLVICVHPMLMLLSLRRFLTEVAPMTKSRIDDQYCSSSEGVVEDIIHLIIISIASLIFLFNINSIIHNDFILIDKYSLVYKNNSKNFELFNNICKVLRPSDTWVVNHLAFTPSSSPLRRLSFNNKLLRNSIIHDIFFSLPHLEHLDGEKITITLQDILLSTRNKQIVSITQGLIGSPSEGSPRQTPMYHEE